MVGFFLGAQQAFLSTLEWYYTSMCAMPGLWVLGGALLMGLLYAIYRCNATGYNRASVLWGVLSFLGMSAICVCLNATILLPLVFVCAFWFSGLSKDSIQWRPILGVVVFVGLLGAAFGNSLASMLALNVPVPLAWISGVLGASAVFFLYGISIAKQFIFQGKYLRVVEI